MCSHLNVTRQLAQLELELRSLSAAHHVMLQLDARLRHDMANALMLVTAFRELVEESDAPDLLADATSAMERALDLVKPFRD